MRRLQTVTLSIILLLSTSELAVAVEDLYKVTYAADQAAEGQVVYQNHCAGCHGRGLEGSEAAPGLMGARFQEA